MSEYEVRTAPAGEVRFIDGEIPRVDCRAILFDSPSCDLGGFIERMAPGSVVLEDDLLALFDHDTSMVLGRTSAGTMTTAIDAAGVTFTAYPPDTTWARDLRVSMSRGDIKGCSFRMLVEEDRWTVEGDMVRRDVLKARVSELTVTSMPAYPTTTAEARSRADEMRVGRVLSSANEGDLSTARDLIDGVLEQVADEGNVGREAEAAEVRSDTGGAPEYVYVPHVGIRPMPGRS